MFDNINALSPEFDAPYEALVVDRPEELDALSHAVLQRDKIIWIYGRVGTGKTTLLRLFLKRYANWFKKHRTDVEYVYGRDYEKVKQELSKAAGKPEYENTLLIIDESEHLSKQQLDQIIELKKEKNNLKLIFSSRQKPHSLDPEIKHNILALSITPPDLFKVLQKRFKLIKDETTITHAREIFDEYLQNVKHTDKSPREVLNEINELFHKHPDIEASVAKEPIEIEQDESGNVVGIKADFIGIIFALVLFIISYLSAKQSEKNIVEKIDGVKSAVEHVVSLYASENDNLYFVNRPVNFRAEPSTKESNILKILQPNTLVSLVKREGKWMYVKYSDYVHETEKYGWVYEKYLSKIALNEN
jgi:hypothetical protein